MPRFRGLAMAAIGLGILLLCFGLFESWRGGGPSLLPMAAGSAGALFGLVYLLSPTWRLHVIIDDEALVVASPRRQRFRLPWHEVASVVASPATFTCFVDGGQPERSLLVPGPGAPASYDIENKRALYQAIRARVPGERVREVALLEQAAKPEDKP